MTALVGATAPALSTARADAASGAMERQLDELRAELTTLRETDDATANGDAQVFETERPNPHLGSIWSTGILSEMVQVVNIDGTAPETVVDNYAPQVQEILDRSQGGGL